MAEVKVSEASAYWEILPIMRDMARRLGWCLAVYGPLRRDLDMVAIPWMEAAVSHEQLFDEMIQLFGGRLTIPCESSYVDRTGVTVLCRKRIVRTNGNLIDVSVIDPRIQKN
jgi:hypothetical protein